MLKANTKKYYKLINSKGEHSKEFLLQILSLDKSLVLKNK